MPLSYQFIPLFVKHIACFTSDGHVHVWNPECPTKAQGVHELCLFNSNSETTFNKLDIYFVSLEKAIEQPRRQICLLFAEEHYFCALGLPYYL